MKKTKRAIGYVSDIPVPDTDLVICKADQRVRILKYARENNLEIVAIHEDEECNEAFINRPGVQKILNDRENFDVLLVERVWCMSRKMKELTPFLKKLESKDVQVVASSYLWDDISLEVRLFNLVATLRQDKERAVDADLLVRDAA
jgi:DNA invertase Pin-like site-specific DNA recombinase